MKRLTGWIGCMFLAQREGECLAMSLDRCSWVVKTRVSNSTVSGNIRPSKFTSLPSPRPKDLRSAVPPRRSSYGHERKQCHTDGLLELAKHRRHCCALRDDIAGKPFFWRFRVHSSRIDASNVARMDIPSAPRPVSTSSRPRHTKQTVRYSTCCSSNSHENMRSCLFYGMALATVEVDTRSFACSNDEHTALFTATRGVSNLSCYMS